MEKLTKRETEVAQLLALGYTAPEIGKQLFISFRTVETHRINIYGKLQVKSRKELVEKIGQKEMVKKKITEGFSNKRFVISAAIVAFFVVVAIGSYFYVFKPQTVPTSASVAGLAVSGQPQPASPAVFTAALAQRAFTRTFTISWSDLPVAISSTVPVTFTAYLDTKMVQGEKTYYNTTRSEIPAYNLPGSGVCCTAVASFIYIEPGPYKLYARLRYDTGGVAVVRTDTGQVITQVIGYNGAEVDSDGYSFVEDVNVPYFYYFPEEALDTVGYWKLDESSGQRFDSSGQGNNLSDNNTVGAVVGKVGLAADFEFDNKEYLSINDAAQKGLDLSSSFTLVGWMNPETLGRQQVLIGKYDYGNNDRAYRINLEASNALSLIVSPDGTYTNDYKLQVTPSPALSAGVWYHVAGVFDAQNKTLTIYLNGVQLGTRSVSYSQIHNSAAPFMLGANMKSGAMAQNFDGALDEWRVYNRALTGAEIKAFLDIPTPTPTATFIPTPTFTPTPTHTPTPTVTFTPTPTNTPTATPAVTVTAQIRCQCDCIVGISCNCKCNW